MGFYMTANKINKTKCSLRVQTYPIVFLLCSRKCTDKTETKIADYSIKWPKEI